MDLSKEFLLNNNWVENVDSVLKDCYEKEGIEYEEYKFSFNDNFFFTLSKGLSNMVGRDWYLHIDNDYHESIGSADIQTTEQFNQMMNLMDIPYQLPICEQESNSSYDFRVGDCVSFTTEYNGKTYDSWGFVKSITDGHPFFSLGKNLGIIYTNFSPSNIDFYITVSSAKLDDILTDIHYNYYPTHSNHYEIVKMGIPDWAYEKYIIKYNYNE